MNGKTIKICGCDVRPPTKAEAPSGYQSAMYVDGIRVPIVVLDEGEVLIGNTDADERQKMAAFAGRWYFAGLEDGRKATEAEA